MKRKLRKLSRNANNAYRGQLAIVSVFVIVIRSIQELPGITTRDWFDSSSSSSSFTVSWLRSKELNVTNTLSSSIRDNHGNTTRIVAATGTTTATTDWPGKPVSTLHPNDADSMRLVRIVGGGGGDAGPVDNAKEYFQEHFEEFLQIYKNRPDQHNTCGIRIGHSLAIYVIAKRLQPQTIIESGINSGQSTYFFRSACPNAKIISLDPELKPICGQPNRWIDNTNNEYLTGPDNFEDFNQVDWKDRITRGEIDPATTLVFLDDHRGFRNRLATMLQHGFRHVINEDNYLPGEGATRPDRIGLSPKQMWRNPTDPETKWLFAITNYYAEFPPLLPPSTSQYTLHIKKVQGGFLHHTDNLKDMEEPLLRPKTNTADNELFHRLATELDLNTTLSDGWSYQELMSYCFLCYMELAVLPPSLRQAWQPVL